MVSLEQQVIDTHTFSAEKHAETFSAIIDEYLLTISTFQFYLKVNLPLSYLFMCAHCLSLNSSHTPIPPLSDHAHTHRLAPHHLFLFVASLLSFFSLASYLEFFTHPVSTTTADLHVNEGCCNLNATYEQNYYILYNAIIKRKLASNCNALYCTHKLAPLNSLSLLSKLLSLN